MAKTIAELRTELEAKERKVKALRGQRRKIAGQLKALDGQISALQGAGPRRPQGKKAIAIPRPARAKSGKSLSDVLATVLKGRGEMKVAEAAKLALAAGYKTASRQFGNVVSQTLSADKRFRKISRGVYVLAGGQPAPRKKTAAKPPKAPRTAPTRSAAGRKGPQPGSLTSLLVQALTGKKAVPVKDAMAAVLASGYTSKSKNFRSLVNQTLGKGPQFRSVGRGKYALKN